MPEHKFTNHLINETSPYLLAHAHNAVDWYPWGAEALAKAKKEKKPIFLSIGYHTCHWCHVMAHESFEDEAVGKFINDNFVAIKVDREERPDLDTIYMNACQMMTGGGGWPLNLWLTPDQVPFYAGTYFAKNDQYSRPGFTSVCTELNKMWRQNSDNVVAKSLEIKKAIQKQANLEPESLNSVVVIDALRSFGKRFDDKYGGFSGAPKFPSPHQLLFLMTYYRKKPNEDLLNMLTKTLDSMYQGGIYDHVGGGFARYSVDEKWLVPHFEKMLYDNALLLRAYNEAYAITKKPLYKEVAFGILKFVKRELLSLKGGFYTALDADSEGVEGKFYLWTMKEIQDILGDKAEAYCARYKISKRGNFEGKNIPNLIAKEDFETAMVDMSEENSLLLAGRENRVRPALDYKILTSTNGLMITALSHMYRVHGNEEALTMAKEAKDFIHNDLIVNLNLKGSIANKVVSSEGLLDDYAFYIEGLIELYQATYDSDYLDDAKSLVDQVNRRFWDNKNGGYYLTPSDHEALITRPKEAYDGAIPSGNSVMALNLMKLSRLLDKPDLQKGVQMLLKAFGKIVRKSPDYHSFLLQSMVHIQEGTRDLVIATEDKGSIDVTQSLDFFTTRLAVNDKEKKVVDGKTTYYVCEDFTCQLPVHEL